MRMVVNVTHQLGKKFPGEGGERNLTWSVRESCPRMWTI
jgi:hypothetical protein